MRLILARFSATDVRHNGTRYKGTVFRTCIYEKTSFWADRISE